MIQEQLPREGRNMSLSCTFQNRCASTSQEAPTPGSRTSCRTAHFLPKMCQRAGIVKVSPLCPQGEERQRVQNRDTSHLLLWICPSPPPPPLGRAWAEPVPSLGTTDWKSPGQQRFLIHIFKWCSKYRFQANVLKIGWPVPMWKKLRGCLGVSTI